MTRLCFTVSITSSNVAFDALIQAFGDQQQGLLLIAGALHMFEESISHRRSPVCPNGFDAASVVSIFGKGGAAT